MKTFERTSIKLPKPKVFIRDVMDATGCTREQAKRNYQKLRTDEVWQNDEYQVNIDKSGDLNGFPSMDVWHLSIKRLDKTPVHDWRDLQQIKNMLVGEECEALEIYPAENRLVDTANQYHLWAFPNGETVPIGWPTRAVTNKSIMNAVQRPYAEAVEETI